MKTLSFIMILSLSMSFTFSRALAQTPPTPPNFLDFDDEDDAPTGTFTPPAGQNKKSFGDTTGGNPPGFGFPPAGTVGGPDSGANGKGGSKTATPTPRRNRKEAPNLLAKRPKTMADATDKDITDENFPDLIESFDYPNAEIGDIVKAISELTGKNFIIDSSIKSGKKITIIAPSRITVAEAYKAFLSALAINNLTVVPAGKFLKIQEAQSALRENIDTYSGAYAPNTDTIITRIVQLRYISAKEIYNNLGPILVGPRTGEIRFYEPTNTLIISDYGSNIERVMKILHQLDVPGFEEQLEVIRVRYAKAADIAKLVDQIINKGKSSNTSGGGFTAGIPRFTPLGGMGAGQTNEGYSLVIPDEHTNSLIAVGNTQGNAKIKKLVAKLDFRMRPEDSGGVYVYSVRYGDAKTIAETLAGLAQASAAPASGPSGGLGGGNPALGKTSVFGGDVKIVADKTTNALVITASKQDYEVVKSILLQLDIPRDQVYVEGIVMEMAVDDTRQWGISYYNLPGNGFAGRSGFASTKVGTILDPTSDQGGILGFGNPGSTVSVTAPGSTTPINIPSLFGFINFLSSITTTNILSTPQIMALDNEEATLEVGEKVPVQLSQNSTAQGVQTGATREDVTMKLVIKPHISPKSSAMRLEIDQKFEGISPKNVESTALANAGLSTTKRYTKTTVMVNDKNTIVLGGMIQEKENIQITKVPLLGDIPILGWLFKGKKNAMQKMNLVIFLTPRIIRQKLDNVELVNEKMRERKNFIERNAGGKDLQGEFTEKLRVESGGKAE